MKANKIIGISVVVGACVLYGQALIAQPGPPGGGPPGGGPPCALLEQLGLPLPPACTGGEPEVDPWGTFPPANPDACPELPIMRDWPRDENGEITFSEIVESEDGLVLTVNGPPSLFPPGGDARDALPPNLCQTVYSNVKNWDGTEIPHTLTSTPEKPYNLHLEPPVVTEIDPRSPTDDLRGIVRNLRAAIAAGDLPNGEDLQFGLDILEGNPIDRAYSGFPLLHYNGFKKVQVVEPEYADDGVTVVGGNVVVHQIWAGQRIMSNAAAIDTHYVKDVPWTITYVLDTLNRGHEDFAPFGMFFHDPNVPPGKQPGIGIDQTFFPMDDGTRTVIKIPHPPARHYKLTYNWGWRKHPPRVQASENAQGVELGVAIPDWERCVFGEDPTGLIDPQNKLDAIAMIGDLAPAKRMWNLLRAMQADPMAVGEEEIDAFDAAFGDWENRTKLPAGFERDDNFDIHLVYANNTLYGDTRGTVDAGQRKAPFFKRGDQVKVKVQNADYFERAHMIVDFGGLRGWENTFHSTVEIEGAGPWFTFGRAYWYPFLPGPQPIPAADPPEGVERPAGSRWSIASCQADYGVDNLVASGQLKRSKYAASAASVPYRLSMVDEVNQQISELPLRSATMANGNGYSLGERHFILNFNHEPSRRLTIYQFDQLHHDVAVWSTH